MSEYADLKERLKAEGEPISYEAFDAIEVLERRVAQAEAMCDIWSETVDELVDREQALERERDAAVADNAALLAATTAAWATLKQPDMGGTHVPRAKDLLEGVRRSKVHPGAALLAELARLRAVAEAAKALESGDE